MSASCDVATLNVSLTALDDDSVWSCLAFFLYDGDDRYARWSRPLSVHSWFEG
jgi:hypothetical protein